MAVIRRKKGGGTSPVAKSVSEVIKDAKLCGLQLLPFDIEGILKVYEITVSYEDMEDLSGYVEKRGSKWVLGVNLYHSRRRKRFTMAHELGHICLHAEKFREDGKRWNEQIFFRSQLNSHDEKEANEFASDLLIPKDVLLAQIRAGKKRLSELSDIFDVSLDAMRYKAYKLRLISEY